MDAKKKASKGGIRGRMLMPQEIVDDDDPDDLSLEAYLVPCRDRRPMYIRAQLLEDLDKISRRVDRAFEKWEDINNDAPPESDKKTKQSSKLASKAGIHSQRKSAPKHQILTEKSCKVAYVQTIVDSIPITTTKDKLTKFLERYNRQSIYLDEINRAGNNFLEEVIEWMLGDRSNLVKKPPPQVTQALQAEAKMHARFESTMSGMERLRDLRRELTQKRLGQTRKHDSSVSLDQALKRLSTKKPDSNLSLGSHKSVTPGDPEEAEEPVLNFTDQVTTMFESQTGFRVDFDILIEIYSRMNGLQDWKIKKQDEIERLKVKRRAIDDNVRKLRFEGAACFKETATTTSRRDRLVKKMELIGLPPVELPEDKPDPESRPMAQGQTQTSFADLSVESSSGSDEQSQQSKTLSLSPFQSPADEDKELTSNSAPTSVAAEGSQQSAREASHKASSSSSSFNGQEESTQQ